MIASGDNRARHCAVSMSSGNGRRFIALTLEVYYSDISILLIGMISVPTIATAEIPTDHNANWLKSISATRIALSLVSLSLSLAISALHTHSIPRIDIALIVEID